ncbi:MAG: anti-sigma factor antagonist [Calditrichaeota bacterium]|nr:MAG: anti-sigma factor antagonist [Calditrichota bacterium]
MEGIQVTRGRVGARRDIALLRVKGYIDTQTCGDMLHKITEVMNEDLYHIIVDMSQVNYVSSAGWGVFVGEIKGIRENGGDLKIVQMLPEVYEIFEMLEFNRILDCYENIEEAIDDFDYSIGLDITKSISRSFRPSEDNGTSEISPPIKPALRHRESAHGPHKTRAAFFKPPVNEKELPLSEKVKKLVIEDPRQGAWKIKKGLNTERFGYTKVSVFRIIKLLRKLNLDTLEKRFRYYRSR